MKTVELFNSVLEKEGGSYMMIPEFGIIIEPSASHKFKEIKNHFKANALNGKKLNSTFYKSWDDVTSRSRFELLIDQILHYASTYGTGFSDEFVYILNDGEGDIPENKMVFKVIRGISEEDLIEKVMFMLESGSALKEDTVDSLLEILNECNHKLTSVDNIKNKEAKIKISSELGLVPTDPEDFLRLVVYKMSGSTLLIKSKSAFLLYRDVPGFVISKMFNDISEHSLASIFNRFKPIFLEIKKKTNGALNNKINRISKLSKISHKPMPFNILNNIRTATIEQLQSAESNIEKNSNSFQLLKVLNYILQNSVDEAPSNTYFIRNGKTFSKKKEYNYFPDIYKKYDILLNILKRRHDLSGKTFYIPKNVKYSIPTSEKGFIGNIPMGTTFYCDDLMNVGIYWENSWGARDMDLSGCDSKGNRIGWNSSYNDKHKIIYSGDMTSGPATEYLRFESFNDDYIVYSNIYCGEDNSNFNIIVGDGNKVDKSYMMNPNKVAFTVPVTSNQKQTILGVVFKDGKRSAFSVYNVGAGSSMVSKQSKLTDLQRDSLIYKSKISLKLDFILQILGASVVTTIPSTEDYIDLSPNKLERDTIMNLFYN